MGSREAFAELGLAPGATENEVKAAWRRLVSRWHPDRNDSDGAVARMQRINQAYEAIRRSGFPVAADPSGGDRPSRTIVRKVRLTLEEAAAGCTKVLQGKLTDTCSSCEGVGYRVLGGVCARCKGSGTLRQRAWYGWFGAPAACEDCGGDGIARQPCEACGGAGKSAMRRYRFQVRFPHGVRDGDRLHVDGSRTRSEHAPVDLDIRVALAKHPFFGLDADGRIRCEIPVDGFAWIANRAIEVPTLTGMQALTLDRDRLSYVLKGHGFPVERRGPRGDQMITVLPVFPQRLSTDQEILLDQLIATQSAPGGRPGEDRLGDWNRALRAWERDLPRRGR